MAKLTIDLPQKVVNRLQQQVQVTNDNEGTSYTLREWIALHLKEIVIGDELAAAVRLIQQQHQQEANDALQAAIRTARDQLLQEL